MTTVECALPVRPNAQPALPASNALLALRAIDSMESPASLRAFSHAGLALAQTRPPAYPATEDTFCQGRPASLIFLAMTTQLAQCAPENTISLPIRLAIAVGSQTALIAQWGKTLPNVFAVLPGIL